MFNDFIIRPGDRIAQACFREIPQVNFTYVNEISEKVEEKNISLAEEMKAKLFQKRGGFGSTGVQ